jgi:hypothetical protein
MGVAARPMWPKRVAHPPQQFFSFLKKKKKIFKIIYIWYKIY